MQGDRKKWVGRTLAAWRAYAALPQIAAPSDTGPRVLLTGFGAFDVHSTNASGAIVSSIAGFAPPSDRFQAAFGQQVLPDDDGGVVVRGLVLPVLWDVAGAIVVEEVRRFRPAMIIMNGIGAPTQPLCIELGASNHRAARPDVAGVEPLEDDAPVTPEAPTHAGLVASWERLRRAAEESLAGPAAALRPAVCGVELGSFPRPGNRYICNATAFFVNDHLDGQPPLLPDAPNLVRTFVHWPSQIPSAQVPLAASLLMSMVRAQLDAMLPGSSDPPIRGNPQPALETNPVDC